MFRSILYRSYKEEEKPKGNETICLPNKTTTMGIKHLNYDKLDIDGIIQPGLKCNGSDILVGKTAQITTQIDPSNVLQSKYTKKDVSMALRSTDHGIVDQVALSTNEEGKRFVKIRTRSVRIPEIGDKLALRHGQKGTIGMLLPQEDLPFTRDGIVPDITLNSHALKKLLFCSSFYLQLYIIIIGIIITILKQSNSNVWLVLYT
jgi:DNA-directed RNA polymerase II subunit RPB2